MKFELLSHWSIDQNSLDIALMKYYISVKILIEDNTLCYKLQVFSDNEIAANFIFNSLEEAITFTEDVINKDYSVTLDDIKKNYDDHFGKTKIMLKNRYNN